MNRRRLTFYESDGKDRVGRNLLAFVYVSNDGYGAVDDLIHGLADGRNGRRSSFGKVDIIESDDLDLIRN